MGNGYRHVAWNSSRLSTLCRVSPPCSHRHVMRQVSRPLNGQVHLVELCY